MYTYIKYLNERKNVLNTFYVVSKRPGGMHNDGARSNSNKYFFHPQTYKSVVNQRPPRVLHNRPSQPLQFVYNTNNVHKYLYTILVCFKNLIALSL